jgi:hypothetical protein
MVVRMTFNPTRHKPGQDCLHFWAPETNETCQALLIISANVLFAAYAGIKNKYLSLTLDNVDYSTGSIKQTQSSAFRR